MEAIKYWRSEGNIAWNREEPYDIDYGTPKKTVRTDYKFAVLDPLDPKGFSEGLAAFNLLQQMAPPFSTLIPPLPKLPPKTIRAGSDYQYDWHIFDVNDPSTYPTGNPDNGRGWECEDNSYPGRLYQNVMWDLASFTALSVDRYRKQRLDYTTPIYITNPAYQPAYDQQQIELAQLVTLLKEHLVITATHIFPTLPLNGILAANLMVKYNLTSLDQIKPEWLWKWARLENGVWVSMEVSATHPLAVPGPDAGWKPFRKPIRPNPNLSTWNTAAARAIGDYTPEQKLKRILQIT
jgi:hypothetical protein